MGPRGQVPEVAEVDRGGSGHKREDYFPCDEGYLEGETCLCDQFDYLKDGVHWIPLVVVSFVVIIAGLVVVGYEWR